MLQINNKFLKWSILIKSRGGLAKYVELILKYHLPPFRGFLFKQKNGAHRNRTKDHADIWSATKEVELTLAFLFYQNDSLYFFQSIAIVCPIVGREFRLAVPYTMASWRGQHSAAYCVQAVRLFLSGKKQSWNNVVPGNWSHWMRETRAHIVINPSVL